MKVGSIFGRERFLAVSLSVGGLVAGSAVKLGKMIETAVENNLYGLDAYRLTAMFCILGIAASIVAYAFLRGSE
jgi:hypothetical protein